MSRNESPLIVHIVNRFDYGGLENGLANLVNRIGPEVARHVIVAMTESTEFANRVERSDVQIFALHKRPGQDPRTYLRLFRLLRRLRPDIVHTRNVGTLDCQLVAWAAGVPCRIHGEHGWDMADPHGTNLKYRLIRRFWRPFVHAYVALSHEIEHYLFDVIGVPQPRVTRICNGVDTERFRPPDGSQPFDPPAWFSALNATETGTAPDRSTHTFVIGSVTRFREIKDPLNTVRAFIDLKQRLGCSAQRVKLVMVGDGPLRAPAQQLVETAGLNEHVQFTGSENDVPDYYRHMDLFVLGSRAEGISNTVLEALASGLPVVACAVGGNPELIEDGTTGALVPPADPHAFAAAMSRYVESADLLKTHAQAARCSATTRFSLDSMVDQYSSLYTAAAARHPRVT